MNHKPTSEQRPVGAGSFDDSRPVSRKRRRAASAGLDSPVRRLPRHQLLTIGDVADFARTSDKTVRRWIAAGDLRATRLGRLVRVHPDDLERFMARGQRRGGR